MRPIAWLGLFGTLGLLAGCVGVGGEGFGDMGYAPEGYGMEGPVFGGGYADSPGMYAPSFGFMNGFDGGFGGGFGEGDDDDD